MKNILRLIKNENILVVLFFASITAAFFWKFFLKGLVPVPADIIVGIYFPWRDYIWNDFTTGVPFKNGLLSDVVSIIYPWRIYGMELIKKGILPLWIPQALSGAPLLANFQSGLLYPLNSLFFFLSNVNAWSIYIMLQPFLASIFCFAYLKNLKLSSTASMIGATVFAFSGYSIVWLEYGIVGHAGLWLPLIMLSIDKSIERRSIFWFAAGSFSIAFSLLAGYPQIAFFVLLASFLYAFYKVFFVNKYKNLWLISYLFTPFLFGILLSSIQLLPGIEVWNSSIRQTDPTVVSFNNGIIPLRNLITFLAPDFYGNSSTLNYWGWANYNESAGYVGIFGLILALTALVTKRKMKNETILYFKFLLVISLLFAFNTPIAQLPHVLNLPGLGKAVSGRFLYLVDFSLAVLAGFGFEYFQKKLNKKEFFIIFSTILVVFIFIYLFVFRAGNIWTDANWIVNLEIAKRNLILPTLLLILSFAILFINFALKVNFKIILLISVFTLVIFDLFRFGFKYTPFASKNFLYPQTDITNFVKEQKGLYRFVGLIPQSMFIPYGISSPEGYEPLMIKRYSEFANQINNEKFSEISAGSRWITVEKYQSSLLNLLGVKYFLTYFEDSKSEFDPQYLKYPNEQYELIFQHGKSQVYENKKVLPRAFVVHDFQVLNDDEILNNLMDPEFDPKSILLFEKKPEILPEKKIEEESAVVDESTYFNNQVSIKTKTASLGYLFLSDSFYPGWKAYVDNRQEKIYRVNYAFRAVPVPKGEHEVRFVYDPILFKIGSWISLGTLLVLFAIIIIGFLGKWNKFPPYNKQ